MTDDVRGAPPFNNIIWSGHSPENQTVAVAFDADDENKYSIELKADCIPALMGVLAAEFQKLLPHIPEDQQLRAQGLHITGSRPAMRSDGTPSLMLQLQGGAELPLSFAPADLPKLRAQIDELASMSNKPGHH
ncbi:hypothetical protein [Hyphococcus sp.]|uniref:hypothetical protein n=1 Tax=Hyphococcus sp. TaxID=2038636 RepID=UPI0035C6DC70